MNKSWITNPRGQNDSYKKAKKKDLQKENGGGAATSGSFGGGAGTVLTSQDSGVFTPSVNLIKWVQTELQKDNIKFKQQSSSTAINDQTKQTKGLRNPVEFDADPDEQADIKQKDIEKKIRNLDDSENIKNNKPDEKGDASQSVQLSYGSGTESGPTVAGGYRDLDAGRIDAEDEDDKDSPFV